jgi:hypothetical protein
MSRRQLITTVVPAAGAALLGLAAAVLFLVDEPHIAGAIVALLVAGIAVLAVEQRRRAGDVAHMLRLSAERQRAITAQLVTLIGPAGADVDSTSARSTLLGRLEATEARLLDAIAAEQVRNDEFRSALQQRVSPPR